MLIALTCLHANVHETGPSLVNLVADKFAAFIDGKYELILAAWITARRTSARKRDAVPMYLLAVGTFNVNVACTPVNHMEIGW